MVSDLFAVIFEPRQGPIFMKRIFASQRFRIETNNHKKLSKIRPLFFEKNTFDENNS